jgi:hypothetical protein
MYLHGMIAVFLTSQDTGVQNAYPILQNVIIDLEQILRELVLDAGLLMMEQPMPDGCVKTINVLMLK